MIVIYILVGAVIGAGVATWAMARSLAAARKDNGRLNVEAEKLATELRMTNEQHGRCTARLAEAEPNAARSGRKPRRSRAR